MHGSQMSCRASFGGLVSLIAPRLCTRSEIIFCQYAPFDVIPNRQRFAEKIELPSEADYGTRKQRFGARRKQVVRLFASVGALLPLLASAALAQVYSDRPVHVLVGYAAGSGPDIQARTVSNALSAALGQSFVV